MNVLQKCHCWCNFLCLSFLTSEKVPILKMMCRYFKLFFSVGKPLRKQSERNKTHLDELIKDVFRVDETSYDTKMTALHHVSTREEVELTLLRSRGQQKGFFKSLNKWFISSNVQLGTHSRRPAGRARGRLGWAACWASWERRRAAGTSRWLFLQNQNPPGVLQPTNFVYAEPFLKIYH